MFKFLGLINEKEVSSNKKLINAASCMSLVCPIPNQELLSLLNLTNPAKWYFSFLSLKP